MTLKTESNELQDIPAKKRVKALRRLGLIKEFTGFCKVPGRVKTEAVIAFCSQKKIKRTTFYRWLAAYKQQGIAGLVDNRGGGKFITQTISPEAWELFKSMYLTEQQLSVKTCWQNINFTNKNEGKNWRIPALAYMYRLVKQIPMRVQVLHREGLQAYNAKCAPFIQRDPESVEPGAVWVGDNHQFNCKIFQRGSWQRPWITAWQDMRSRAIVGFHVSFGPNQTTVLLAMKRGIEKYGPPDAVKIDNGRDYDSQMFTGQTKKQRRSRKHLDEPMLAGIYAMMNIAISFAIPYRPQSKPIERFFDTLDCQFTKTFATYCGKDSSRKPEDHQERLQDRQLAAELNLERFTALLDRFVEAYNQTSHTGVGMEGKSPLEVLQNRSSQRVLADGVADLLLRVWSRELSIGKNGVRFRGIFYGQYNENLLLHQGKKVRVSYDPDDLRTIQVYDAATLTLLAIAEQNRLIQYGRAVDEEALREAMRAKSRALKITRQFRTGDAQRTAAMDLTELSIAAIQDAAKQRIELPARHPTLRPVITPLTGQIEKAKKLELIKEVRTAAGGETIARVLGINISALKEEPAAKIKLFDE